MNYNERKQQEVNKMEDTLELVNKFQGIRTRGTEDIFNIMLQDMELTEEQVEAVLQCYTQSNLKGIISMEMGTGKTYVAMGLLQIARCLNPEKKSIITVPKNKIQEFKGLIETSLHCNVMAVTGQKRDIDRLKREFQDVDVIIAQISFWTHSSNSLAFMYNNLEEFYFSFFDEAAGKEAAGFLAFLEFSRQIPLSFLSNATPIGQDTTLARHLLYGVGATDLSDNMFKRRYSESNWSGGRETSQTVLIDKIRDDFDKYYINLNRTDMGLIAGTDISFHPLEATQVQQYWMDKGLRSNISLYSPEVTEVEEEDFEILPEFSPKYVPALAKLQQILVNNDKKMIIFARNTMTIIQLNQLMIAFGKNPYIIDGQHTRTDREQLQAAIDYNEDPNGVMITNIIKGTNLGTAEHIVIYDTPSDVQQLIFRAIRGMKSKTVTIDWLYYPGYEVHVLENALQQTANVANLLEREIDMLPQLQKEVRRIGGQVH